MAMEMVVIVLNNDTTVVLADWAVTVHNPSLLPFVEEPLILLPLAEGQGGTIETMGSPS